MHISTFFNRTKIVLYSGEKNGLQIRYLVAEIFSKNQENHQFLLRGSVLAVKTVAGVANTKGGGGEIIGLLLFREEY